MEDLPPWVLRVCDDLEAAGMEVSRVKGQCTASKDALGEQVAAALSSIGMKYRRIVKSLGADLGAGTRRTAKGATIQLNSCWARIRRPFLPPEAP